MSEQVEPARTTETDVTTTQKAECVHNDEPISSEKTTDAENIHIELAHNGSLESDTTERSHQGLEADQESMSGSGTKADGSLETETEEAKHEEVLAEVAPIQENIMENVASTASGTTPAVEKAPEVPEAEAPPQEAPQPQQNIIESREQVSDRITNFIKGEGEKEDLVQFSDDEIIIESGQADSTSSEASDSDSDSGSDSDSSSDSESSDSEIKTEVHGDLEEEDETPSGPILSKNEVDEKPQSLPEDYKVPENAPLEHIGEVSAFVDRSVIIKASVSGEFRILKEDSILCFEDRELLGPLYETFGKLQSPVYRVLLDSTEKVSKLRDRKGSKVFYVVPDSQFLLTDTIKKIKGTDASNCHDEELPEDEQEFSDDEQELARKQEKSRKKKQKKQEKDGEQPKKKQKDDTFSTYGFAPPKADARPVAYNPIYQHDKRVQNPRLPEAPVAANYYGDHSRNASYQQNQAGPNFQQDRNPAQFQHNGGPNFQPQQNQPMGYGHPNMAYMPQYNAPHVYSQQNQFQGQYYQQSPMFMQQGNPYPNMAYNAYQAPLAYQSYPTQLHSEYAQHQQHQQSNNMHGFPGIQPVSGAPPQNGWAQGPTNSNPQSNAALQQLHSMISNQLQHQKPEEGGPQ